MILIIDNYDSFTYNLVHLIGELSPKIVVKRNDAISVTDAINMKPSGIVLSPGPCDPDQAGICLELTLKAAENEIPLLGVCLGHQTIAQAFGGDIIRCHEIIHGKLDEIHHENDQLFVGIPNAFNATRYHSLIVSRENLPKELNKTAWLKDGTIMGLSHKKLPIFGVQFHPESIASQYGYQLIKNFLDNTGIKL
jgi:anthranilate synthase component 2